MNAVQFPDMLSNNQTQIVFDYEATLQNLTYLILSSKKTLFGDPYFGTSIKRLMFEQNNKILQDLIIDDIYTAILTFMPQLILDRKDIKVTSDRDTVYVNIKATNLLDYQTNLYNINLTGSEEI